MSIDVSIHAPRVGRDFTCFTANLGNSSFNPRAPCGARLDLMDMIHYDIKFQSTRPVWGATAKEVTTSLFCHIFMGITRHKYDFLDV